MGSMLHAPAANGVHRDVHRVWMTTVRSVFDRVAAKTPIQEERAAP